MTLADSKMRRRLVMCYAFNVFDMIATLLLVRFCGIEAEVNPIGRFMLSSTETMLFTKLFIVGIALIVLYLYRKRKIAVLGSYFVFATYSFLTVYHLIILMMVSGV